MAIQISGTTVIDNSRNLTNIESVSGNGIATQAEAEAGTNNDQIMTPLRVSQAILELPNVGVTTTASNKTIVNREYCTVTASGKTITLPSSPTEGDEVSIGVEDFTNTVIGRNGSNIMGIAQDMTVNVRNATVDLVYIDSTRGWRIS